MRSQSCRRLLKESENSEEPVTDVEKLMLDKMMKTSKFDMMVNVDEADRLAQNIMSNTFENEEE